MSPALRKIKELLNSVRASPSMKAATAEMKNLGTETAKFATFGGNAATALGAIGLGGLATAGSLAAVVVQMRALGDRSLQMKELGRETGVTIDWLNAWSHAGLSFGVTANSMQSALNHLTSQMPQFRNHIGDLYGLLSQKWPSLTKKLLGEDSEHQVHDILAFLDQLKNQPMLQRQLLGELFGSGDDMEKLMRNGAKGFFDEFAKQQKSLNPINPELTKQAQEFRDATIQFNDALENFENRYGPEFLKQMKSVVDEATTLTNDLNGKKANPDEPQKLGNALKSGDIVALGKELGKVFASSVRAEFGIDLSGSGPSNSTTPQKAPPPPVRGNLFHRSSYSGDGNGLFQRTAFSTAATGATFGLTGIIADGTKSGVLAAFRELMAASAAGGIQKADYVTDDASPVTRAARAIGRQDGSTGNYRDPNAFYDAIIQSEGTGKHGDPYDTSLGYTKSPMPLTKMTLAQSLEWGDWIRHNTAIGEATNSSAKGAFQIVNATQLAAMKALGLKMSDLFSEENQRKMAS